ncbi:MAG: glycosyltransferase [Brevibacterium sp.]
MRISVLSLHTSPAAQPGQGDAGGMNVYVDQSVRALAEQGHIVDVYTADPGGIDGCGTEAASSAADTAGASRAAGAAGGSRTSGSSEPASTTLHIAENITLHQLPIAAGSKDELADAIDELSVLLLAEPGFTGADLIWAHYWISAEAALRAQRHRTSEDGTTTAPRIVVSMHTIGAVKNRDSETSHERPQRLRAEEAVASAADLIVANTPAERRDLIHELGADPDAVVIARPGVDHDLYTPGDRAAARSRLGFDAEESIVLYVGRMQFIKGTDIVVDALAGLRENNPRLASRTRGILLGAVSGGESSPTSGTATGTATAAKQGTTTDEASGTQPGTTKDAAVERSAAPARASSAYLRELASAIAAEPSVEVRRPVPAGELVDYYRAADVLLVPSRSESFGLVAVEAAASGLPAIASAVGGLPEVVEHDFSGVLIADHNPRHWAMALERLLLDDALRAELSAHATARSARFDWSVTVQVVLGALGIDDDQAVPVSVGAGAAEPAEVSPCGG